MSHKELKEYVLEIISHHINDTEEEMEAWKEMSDFFGEQFEIVVLEIQKKFSEENNLLDKEKDPHSRLELIEKNNLNQDKRYVG